MLCIYFCVVIFLFDSSRSIEEQTFKFQSENATLKPKFSSTTSRPLICYLTKTKNFDVESVDPFLCTHIITGFAGIKDNELQLGNKQALEFYKKVLNLRRRNKNLKVLICIGGSEGFRSVVSSSETISVFSKNAANISTSFGFDGIDLDWEFPSWGPGSKKREKTGFKLLLQALREKLDSHYLLSAAVAAPRKIIDKSYDADIHKSLDFLSVMCYDFHYFQKVLPFTGHNSPLYSRPDEAGYFASLNINATVHYWQSLGVPKSKLVVGVPTYGHTFKLMNADNYYPGAVAIGYGFGKGWSSYSRTCKFLYQGKRAWDDYSKVPYAFGDQQWLSYDDEVSLSLKADYVKKNNLFGMMVWAINLDDWDGYCRNGPFPLLHALKRVLNN